MGTMNNRWWMDPILLGKPVTAYGIYATHKSDMPRFKTDLIFLPSTTMRHSIIPLGAATKALTNQSSTPPRSAG